MQSPTLTGTTPGRSSAPPLGASADSPWPFLTLSHAELSCLVEHGVIQPTAESPVSLVLESAADFEEDAAAAAESLLDKGLVCRLTARYAGPAEPAASEAGALFRRSLEVLAAPEARLVIVRQSPEEEPSLIPLFVSGEFAAPGFIDDEGLHLGAPLDRTQLLDSIHINLQSDPSDELERPVSLSPLVLQAVETLWRGTGQPLRETIERWRAHTLLLGLIDDADLVRGLLRLLTTTGVIREVREGYRLTDPYLPWLERVLSGHSCAVEYFPIDEEGKEHAEPDRLLFFGPPGQRILCTQPETDGQALADEQATGQPTASVEPTEDDPGEVLYFSAPSDRLLSWKLRRLLTT
ncbi:MAG: hypothetical protein KDD11_12235 [Acidobacteria bacterium]|nr:hypothetical protein [Acidobacteriota bacterium]